MLASDCAVVSQLLVLTTFVAPIRDVYAIFNHAATSTLRTDSILYCVREALLVEILRRMPFLLLVRQAATDSTATVCGREVQ